ncbi:SPOUT family RNA methylase [Methanocaldococcus indicus]|uniref:SPOUT family RNA methylase n=1 Tax=Methanocaldococcus indicus TaxID=213231 RepID=UPI003C6D36AD
MKFIVKTGRGFENIVINHLKNLVKEDFKAIPSPDGFHGVVIVECEKDIRDKILEIPEVERVLKVDFEVPADFNSIVNTAEKIKEFINENDKYAVETIKRGEKDYNSIDINKVLGAKIKDLTNAKVDLENPNKVVYVEIFKDKAYICIEGKDELKNRKYSKDKLNARKLFKKVVVVQMPYLGEKKVCRKFGEAIGRAAQAFEIRELIIAPKEKVDAYELMEFLKGVKVGQESRYDIQKRAYPFDIKKVKVSVQDLYQVVRDKRRKNRLIIITDPKGDEIYKVKNKLLKDLERKREILVLCGSREGIPRGLFRFADYVLDLAPKMTFATEHTIPTALTALFTIYSEKFENNDNKK